MSQLAFAQIAYPTTRKVDHVDTYHGEKISDPYRWLEDDNSAETKAWVKAQNEVTRKFLDAIPERAEIQKRYTALYNFEKYSTPWKEGGRYFWSRNDGLQQQSVYYVADSLSSTPRVLLDPNTLSKDGTVSIAFMSVSRDGKRLAYGVSSAGSDWTEIRVRDIDSGKDLPDRIQWVKFSSAEWSADSKGFFYGAYDAPKKGEKLTGQNFFQKAYYHRLGSPQSKDTLIYERKDQKEWGFGVWMSEDGKHVFNQISRGTERRNGLLWAPTTGATKAGGVQLRQSDFKTLTLDFDASYEVIGSRDDTVWIKTDLNAPFGRVIEVDLNNPDRKNWKTIVPESKQTLESANVVGGMIVVQYLRDARSVVERVSLDGKSLGEVALPGIGSAGGFGGKFKDTETFYSFTSMTDPSTIFRYELAKNESSIFRKPKTAFDGSKYDTKQVFVTSKDGTKVPVFIAQRKDIKLDGNNPVIVSAYGGFGISTTPRFRITAAMWAEMGGVFVEAAIRGGNEYGKAWHDAAKGAKRQNAY
ncbi:MAG: prolyl oligopeptidase family serine peptidase, partial [Casimicrobium sp.]